MSENKNAMNVEIIEICNKITDLDNSLKRLRSMKSEVKSEVSQYLIEEYTHALNQEIKLLKNTIVCNNNRC